MAKNQATGRATSIPVGLAWGVLSAMVTALAGIAISAKLIDLEIIQWKNIGYAILVIQILSSWFGAKISVKKIKRQKLIMCALSGIGYFTVLAVITALFFGGQYNGAGETAILIFCGSILAAVTEGRNKPNRIHNMIKI